MKNPLVALEDRMVHRLMTEPECLEMSEFSRVSALFVTTFCLAGLILDESGVQMEYGPEGRAIALLAGESQPSPRWVAYEMSLSDMNVRREMVVIQAKARELWADQYGDAAAKLLPFYARDWDLEPHEAHQVTPEQVISLLRSVNAVANEVAAAA
jgi:hypothetical protein